jgi:hypothetical protein
MSLTSLKTSIDSNFPNKQNYCVFHSTELRLPHPLKTKGSKQVVTQLGNVHTSPFAKLRDFPAASPPSKQEHPQKSGVMVETENISGNVGL